MKNEEELLCDIFITKEYPLSRSKRFPDMIKDEEGWGYLLKYKGMLPLTFTLRAKKYNIHE